MDAGQGDSIVLEEEIDPNYEPTEDEVLEYAKWLGMDLEAERDLFWIAREGLKAPLPENWKPCKTTDTGEIYYFNFASGASTWDHPCDEYYRKLYDDHKKKSIHGKKDSDSKKKKEKDDVDEILGKKSKKKKAPPKTDGLSAVKTSLDKKPLGGLPSKLGPTSGGLGPLGGLKPVGGLGRPGPKALARAESDDEKENDDDDEEEAKVEIKAIGRKPLLGVPKAGAKEELDKKSASLEKELADLESAHAEKIAALEAKVAAQEDTLRDTIATNEKKLSKIQASHDDEVASMKELEKKLSKRRKDMETENRKQLDELEEAFVDKKRELRQHQDKDTKGIEEKHRQRIDELLAKHEHALEEMRRKQEMETEHREKVEAETSSRLQDEVDGLKAEVAKLKSKLQQADDEETERNTKLTEARATIERLEARVQDLEASSTTPDDGTARESAVAAEAQKWAAKLEAETTALEAKWRANMVEVTTKLDAVTAERDAAVTAASDANTVWQRKLQEATAASSESVMRETAPDTSVLDALQAKYEALQSKLDALQSEHDALQSEHDALDTAHAALQAKYDALHSTHEALQSDLRGEVESATAKAAEWQAKCEAATRDQADWQAKYEAACNAAPVVTTGDSDATAWTAKTEALQSAAKAREATLQAEIADLREAKAADDDAMSALTAAKDALQTKFDALVTSHAATTLALDDLQVARLASDTQSASVQSDEIDRWKRQCTSLETQLAESATEHEAAIETLQKSQRQLQDNLAAAENDYRAETSALNTRFHEEKKHLEAQLAQVQSQWTSLQSQESSTSSVLSALQNQLRQALDEKAAVHLSMDEQLEATRKTAAVYETTISSLKRDASDVQTTHAAALQAALSETHKVEAAKRALDDQKAALERKLKQKDAEIAALTAQLQAEPSSSPSATVPAWELEKWTTQAKALEAEKTEVQARYETAMHELDALGDQHHRLQLEKDQAEKKGRQLEADRDAAQLKLKSVQAECDTLTSKLRSVSAEVADAKSAANKLKMTTQSLEAQLQKQADEASSWEARASKHRDAAEALELQLRSLKLQMDESSFQLSMEQQEKTLLQQEVDALKAKAMAAVPTDKSSSEKANSSAWKEQVDTLLLEKQQAVEKLRLMTQKLQDVESKSKTSIESLERSMASITTEKQAIQERCEKVAKQLQQAEGAVRRLEQERDEIDDNYKRTSQDKVDVESKVRSLVESQRSLETQLREATHHVESLEDEKRQLQYSASAFESRLKRYETDIDRLKTELATTTTAKETAETKLRSETASLEAKLKAIRQELADSLQRRSNDDESQRDQLTSQHKRELDDLKKELLAKVATAEADTETLRQSVHDRAKELQLKSKELETISLQRQKLEVLSASVQEQARQEKVQAATDLEALKARLKAVQTEKDELFLLASASTPVAPTMSSSTTASNHELHSVKLQMAHVNQNELETHLKEVTSQLDTWRRKASMLDLRCRDLALEIEGLHVENATLRSAAQRLHTNALESLSSLERLNYEHKKRLLRSEYMGQLRDFSDREELALARQKARVRASCERQLEEVVLAFQHQTTQRLEHEETEFQAALRHCQHDHELQLQRALKGFHDKLAAYQRELQDKQTVQMHAMAKQLHEEEAHLAARLRDTHQLNREDALSKVQNLQPGELPELVLDKPQPLQQPAPSSPYRSPNPAWEAHSRPAAKQKVRRRNAESRHRRVQWQRKIEKEVALLEKAKHFVAKQKKALKTRMAKLQCEKDWWRHETSISPKDPSWVSEMRQLLELHAEQLANDARDLKATEKWVAKRASKIHALERACDHVDEDHDDDDDVSTNESVDATLERLHDELLQDGAAMSHKLRPRDRENIAWPSDVPPVHRPQYDYRSYEQPAYARTYSAPMQQLHPSEMAAQNRYYYHRQPDERHYGALATPSYKSHIGGSKVTDWAAKREMASAAASAHGSYLGQLAKELQAYTRQAEPALRLSDGEVDLA
ncbi:hypothetical protein SDRG_13596 [Saprolegnia diclina VS20]|uniref:WW domain-containing protein n=1 Tax=Saprolegnia diclina (strain VS20) TaxID=1156394 RepID=T0RG99_SAPDV|nr:hypothetical protein SDRG_13596 [Saprolegnia diclina VS20]EQC28722.1 hypothetical protein SDRG_13596 [Saprolegnia diclina VS20]|eukprot:XP_008617914.1 hypothetical protein SDRG_13596 [Saprolegnia diclina VS20]